MARGAGDRLGPLGRDCSQFHPYASVAGASPVKSLGTLGSVDGEGATVTRTQRLLLLGRQCKMVVCVCEGPEAGRPASTG